VVAVQLLNPLLVDQLDREMAVADAGSLQRRFGCAPQARVVCLDLDQRDARRRNSGV
jgi:hypothetical protein